MTDDDAWEYRDDAPEPRIEGGTPTVAEVEAARRAQRREHEAPSPAGVRLIEDIIGILPPLRVMPRGGVEPSPQGVRLIEDVLRGEP